MAWILGRGAGSEKQFELKAYQSVWHTITSSLPPVLTGASLSHSYSEDFYLTS